MISGLNGIDSVVGCRIEAAELNSLISAISYLRFVVVSCIRFTSLHFTSLRFNSIQFVRFESNQIFSLRSFVAAVVSSLRLVLNTAQQALLDVLIVT